MELRSLILHIFAAVVQAADLLFVEDLVPYYSEEIILAKELGYVSEIVSVAEWKAKKTKDFASYKAIIISDPSPGANPADIQFLADTAGIWGPAVQGNIIIHGMSTAEPQRALWY